ncbi:MAG TPA: hypothetical protein VFS95_10810 [Telluria sp.]|nr:hypothetical protein [Telluria sp.]
MKLIPSMMFAALCALTVAAPATAHEHRCKCGTAVPAPPAPPAPPNAPLPPSEPGMPAMPPMAPMPAPPAPPAPPPVPDAPAEAHAACAAKTPGTKMTFSAKRGTTMSGTCERDNRGMYFEINSIRTVN